MFLLGFIIDQNGKCAYLVFCSCLRFCALIRKASSHSLLSLGGSLPLYEKNLWVKLIEGH